MFRHMKKLLTALLALLILSAAVPAAAAEETTLQLTFIGMYARSDGSYEARSLPGRFEVYQNGVKQGVVSSDEQGSESFRLTGSGNVQLIPVMDSIPEEITVNPQGYIVSVVPGQVNVAPVVLYAKAGLFKVHTESTASFSLITERGEKMMTFTTDSRGDYALPVAIPAGHYTLRMESASLAIAQWRDKIINVEPYTGPDSVLYVDAGYFYYPQVTLRPVTPTPTNTATPRPGHSGTATTAPVATPTPEQTESLPTVPGTPAHVTEPEAQATPSATPTATPTMAPNSGTLVLAVQGRGAEASYSISASGKTYAEGPLKGGESARVPDLYMGNYIVTINLPDDVMLTGLNGYPSQQRRMAQWLVTISAGRTSVYEVELNRTGAVSGEVNGLNTPVQVAITGVDVDMLSVSGAFRRDGLTPDIYTVTCVLPEGEYTGEGWSFVRSNGQLFAVARADLSSGGTVTLAPIAPKEYGAVSGEVNGFDGQLLPDVQVQVIAADGTQAASAITDAQGAWKAGRLEPGAYTVQYHAVGELLIAPQTVVISADNMNPALSARQEQPASVRVRVFVDENNNGVLAKSEPFLAGAEVALLRQDGNDSVVVASGVTGSSGEVILHAPEGEYTLRCTMPQDYGFNKKGTKDLISNSAMDQSGDRMQELQGVRLTTGVEKELGIGAGRMCILTGTVWHDVNADGLWQSGESGVSGMRIVAEGTRNGLVYETVTDEQGRYELRQIRNGTYSVSYHAPEGLVFTYKASGAKQIRSIMTTEADRVGVEQIVFDAGDVVDEQNVGLVTEAVVEGYCFLDANYNGYFDEGEEPIAGVEMELFRQSNNKRLKTAWSDENGYYRFGNVRGDTFKVKALLPVGMTFSINVEGDANANQFAPRDGRREQSVLGIKGRCGDTASVLLGAIQYGSLSGVIYQDDNFSGSWETGEKIVSGLAVTLLDENGEVLRAVKTNKNGAYSFGELTPGQYRLRVTAPNGFAFTEGSVILNKGAGLGESELITVRLGDVLSGMDIGLIVPARVSGKAFADANDNGLYDADERGLAGTRVTLMKADGMAESMMVNADGTFLFDSVLPGRYYLRYELPDNGVFSPRVAGGNQVVGEGSDGAGDWFTVNAGDVWNAPVCGGLDLGLISGSAFCDVNGSAVQDADERSLPGMTLTLTPSRSDLSEMTIVTGPDGSFTFDDLRPDVYSLSVRCPEGYVLSRLTGVTLGLAHGVAEQKISLTVGMGSVWTEQKLGCVLPSTYSGSIWLDENLNGRRDDHEMAASGENLVLVDQRTGEELFSLVSDEQGRFTAEGLAPGMYALRYALEDDVHPSTPGDSTFVEADGALVMGDIAVQENTNGSGALLGLVRETTVGGLVWLDSDGNTVPVCDAKVTLVHPDGRMVATMTGKDGLYAFDGLMPGGYTVCVDLPAGWLALEPGDRRLTDGSHTSILVSVNGNGGVSGEIDVRMAQHQMKLDIGSVLTGRLGDFCWLDLNANGLQDGMEGGIPGVKIALTRNGKTIAETVSDQYGYYVFEELYPGEYELLVTWPDEVKPTQVRTDLPMVVSVLYEDGSTLPLPVDSDGVNYDGDLGFILVKEGKYPEGYGEGAKQTWVFVD